MNASVMLNNIGVRFEGFGLGRLIPHHRGADDDRDPFSPVIVNHRQWFIRQRPRLPHRRLVPRPRDQHGCCDLSRPPGGLSARRVRSILETPRIND